MVVYDDNPGTEEVEADWVFKLTLRYIWISRPARTPWNPFSNKRKKYGLGRRTAQWVKCLLCQSKDMSSDPQHTSKAKSGGVCL